jgi:CHAT domain-containing protein
MRHALFEADNFYALPGVVAEARDVAAILEVEPLLDEQVTEAVLRQYMPGHEVIHLATHGFLHRVPLLNGVVTYMPEAAASAGADRDLAMLPGGDEDLPRGTGTESAPAGFTGDDGFLTMSEVMGIPLDGCELVVLSCCHSAEGEVAPGEGVMGISQGFLYAGARAVLATLAKVDDQATQRLMVEFYRNWREEGMSKREALRAAKLTLTADPQFAAPRYWAPFVLYGAE